MPTTTGPKGHVQVHGNLLKMKMNGESADDKSAIHSIAELGDDADFGSGSSNAFLNRDAAASFTDTEIGSSSGTESDYSDGSLHLAEGGGHDMWITQSTDHDHDNKDGSGNRAPTPLPKLRMTICFCLQISEALNVTTLFPYMAFLVEDVGKGGPDLGDYVGFLAGCFCLSQLVSAMLWAKAADRYGRRPILFLGTLGTGCGMLIFGLARTYEQAVLGRLLSGLLCGNLGVLKAYLTEITDKSNRGGGFAILSMAWSIGTVFSPLIGGLLVKPCELYPNAFAPGTWQGAFFTKFPYALPSIVCVTVNIFTAFAVLLFLEETNNRFRSRPGSHHGHGHSSAEDLSAVGQQQQQTLQTQQTQAGSDAQGGQLYMSVMGDSSHGGGGGGGGEMGDDPLEGDSHSHNGSGSGDIELSLVRASGDRDALPAPAYADSMDADTDTETETVTAGSDKNDDDDDAAAMGQEQEEEEEQQQQQAQVMRHRSHLLNSHEPLPQTEAEAEAEAETHEHPTEVPLWRRPLVMFSVGSYGVLCFAQVILDESLPMLFKLEPKLGGFGFDSHEIGEVLSLVGLVFTGFTVGILPLIANSSKSTMLKIGCLGAIPSTFAFPFLPRLLAAWGKPSLEWPLLVLVLLWKNISSCLAFTAVTVQVNQCVADHELTSVNAIGQMMAALSRALGPALGGVLWSIWLSVGNVWGNFAIVNVVFVLTVLINRYVPRD